MLRLPSGCESRVCVCDVQKKKKPKSTPSNGTGAGFCGADTLETRGPSESVCA